MAEALRDRRFVSYLIVTNLVLVALAIAGPIWFVSGLAALAAAGVDEIPAAGAPFDPRLHDGAGARPGGPPGVVLEVVRRGFRWRGRVLRRAQVVIAREATADEAITRAVNAGPAA